MKGTTRTKGILVSLGALMMILVLAGLAWAQSQRSAAVDAVEVSAQSGGRDPH